MKFPSKHHCVLALIWLVILASSAAGQTIPYSFYRQFGTAANDYAFGVASDATGSYVVGCTNAAAFAKPCEGSAADADGFVRKYDTSGTLQWAITFDSGVNDLARSVAVDSSGVYVAGYTSNPSTTDANAFVRKYNLNGTTLLWQASISTVVPDFAYGVAVDATGVYGAGYTTGDFTNPIGLSAGLSDAFVVKLDLSTGAELWKKQYDIGLLSTDAAYGVAANGTHVYLAGSTGTAGGQSDAVLLKLDATLGTLLWTRQFGDNIQDDAAFGVSLDGGGVYAAGCTHDGTVNGSCDSGDADAFVRKYDSLGNLLWSDVFGGTTPSFDAALSVTSDLGAV
jgi:hypothetical protein